MAKFWHDGMKDDDWWIHLELLGRSKQTPCKGYAKPLAVAFIRAFLGARRTIRFGPSHPRGQREEILLRVCADEGAFYHGLSAILIPIDLHRQPCSHKRRRCWSLL